MKRRLFDLLPAYIREADDLTFRTPLQKLLAVIEEQAELVSADIAALYDNWFIETCADWVVPYIGDLVGYEPLVDAGGDVAVPRSEVADVIRTRRRKGTLGVLETVARDATGWPAIALEFEQAIAATFSPLKTPGSRERTLDLRDGTTLGRLRDVRSTAPRGVAASGSYTLGNVGVVVSRLRPYGVSRGDAACVVTQGDHCYTFDALGFDVPLVSALQPLPATLLPRDLAREYGERKSVALWTRPAGNRSRLEPVPVERIVAADLKHWRFRPRPGQIAVDPALGRLSFAPGHAPDGVVVRYSYGGSADIGAGQYPRELSPAAQRFPIAHGGREEHHHLRATLAKWKASQAPDAAIEFGDSHVYDESDLRIELAEDQRLEIRAEDGARPILRIEDRSVGHLDALRIRGGARSTLVLDGLVIARRGIEIAGEIESVTIRRCTLVPNECPIVVLSPTVRLIVEQSIIGDIRGIDDETRQEPNAVSITDSIVGAHGKADAIGSPDAPSAFFDLSVARSTIFGRANVHGVGLIENAIFVQPLAVRRRETGCVRYSYLAPQSRTPQRFACLSEPAPVFMSKHFAAPWYGRLAAECPPAIAACGESRGEPGAFFTSRSGQKAANLKARLAEFIPPDVNVEIRFVGEV